MRVLGDLLRRLLAARAVRAASGSRTRPLSEARITRVIAVGSSACADLVPHTLPANPFARASKGRKVKPLWTAPRAERLKETGEIPGPVMVWTREQGGAFLDSIESERLYALYHLAAYFGPRRTELACLHWADTDLAGNLHREHRR